MNNLLEYKGYHAEIEYDNDDEIFVGSVFGINDSLSFHGNSVSELKEMFAQSIDNYLDLCKTIGKDPDKEFKGSFNVRIDPSLHRDLALEAFKNKRSLNKEIELAVSYYLGRQTHTQLLQISISAQSKATTSDRNFPEVPTAPYVFNDIFPPYNNSGHANIRALIGGMI